MGWWARFKGWIKGIDFSEIDAVLRLVVGSCGYLPTIKTVIAIFASGNPALITSAAVASSICDALKRAHTASSLYGDGSGPVAEVEGIVIQGGFVK